MAQHYHVCENTPGYIPESDVLTFTNQREAGQYAYTLAQQLRDDGYRVQGNQRDGYYGTTTEKLYDLGRVIEIIPCNDATCDTSEEW